MKNSLRTICLLLALIMTASLLTACPNNAKTSQKDDRTDFTTRETETGLMPGIDEPNQSINTLTPADPDKCGYVREDSSSPITEDDAHTIMGKTMMIKDWFNKLQIVYIDEVTPESLDKITAELVSSGCSAIVFDLGDPAGVYGHYRDVLVKKYPNTKIWPVVEYGSETTTSSETSSSASTSGTTAKPAAKALGKVKVTDAYKSTYTSPEYGKVTSRIPKVTIDGVSTSAVNKEIAKLIPKAKSAAKNKYTYYHYSYYVGKTYVSIIVSYPDYNDTGTSYIYNISRKTGKRLSKKQMLKTLGISSKKFNSRVKKAIKKCYNKMGNPGNDKYFKSQYKKAMSSKTIKRAIPWVNSKGKVCFLINELPVPGGADWCSYYSTC